MKVNWKLALMCAAMVAFVACKDKNQPVDPGKDDPKDEEAALVLDQNSVQLEVGASATITATVEATWTSSDAEVATVVPGNDGGKSALVTAVKEGNAVISATTKGGQTKTCIVVVKAKEEEKPQGGQLKGSQVWPIILDGTTLEANQSKIVASFQPNDNDQNLWVWDNTYEGVDATGLNFHGNGDGYLALSVTTLGWAGAGFNLATGSAGCTASEALCAAIVANPDDYFLHLAIKSTDNFSHCFYFMNNEGTKFGLGKTVQYDAPAATLQDFPRDGAWHEFDIPLSSYASAIASATSFPTGNNVFVFLTEGTQGAKLYLDAVYFYKK
jgi:hypothetical protein